MKLSEDIEIDGPPAFDMGDRVQVRKLIRNDGTFPGKDIGFHLAKKGTSATSSASAPICNGPTFIQCIF
jgi:hypothetical protein